MAEGFQPTGFQSTGFQGTSGAGPIIQELAGSISGVSVTIGNIFLLHILLLSAVAVTSTTTGFAFLFHYLSGYVLPSSSLVGAIFSFLALTGQTLAVSFVGGLAYLYMHLRNALDVISAAIGNLSISGTPVTPTAPSAAKKPKYLGGVVHSRNRRRR